MGLNSSLAEPEAGRHGGSEQVYILIRPHSLFFPDCRRWEPWNQKYKCSKSQRAEEAHLRLRQGLDSITTLMHQLSL